MSDIDNVSLHSLTNTSKYVEDSIPFRLNFIKELLNGNEMEPLINIHSNENNCETEQFIESKGGMNGDPTDSRIILNKKIINIHKVINTIGGKLMYIKSGSTGHTFKGVTTMDNYEKVNFAVKVVAYPKKDKYGNMNDIRRPENAELKMIRLLSYFVVKGETPHIILPIGTFNTSIKPFITLIDDNLIDKEKNNKYVDFVERYNNNEYYDTVSILISEWANKGDLLDFIRKHYKQFQPIHWKVLFFQIISVLAVVQSKYPSFRHNDLKANNILIHKLSTKMKKFLYQVVGKKYVVPNIGYQIKLWDFDFACIPNIVDNKKVSADWTTVINVTPTQNRYYDIHYFFNTLIRKGFFPQFLTEPEIPEEAKQFVNRIVPPKYRDGKNIHKRGRILVNDEFITAERILRIDPYFEDFRKSHEKKNI
jgi:serine/threonine protein kinase